MRVLVLIGLLLSATAVRAADVDWNDVQSVVRAAIDASPALLALKSEAAAARERVTTAGALPNPMLMTGVENQNADLTLDRQMTMYTAGIAQTIPRRARRDAMRTIARYDVERLERQYDVERAEVVREVVQAYDAAAAAQGQLAATEEIAGLAGTIGLAARARYESGSVPQADMIRAKLQQTDLRHQMLALRARRAEAIARLSALLNLPADAAVPLFTARMTHEHAMAEVPATLPETTPAIALLETEVRAADEQIALAKLASKPDWNVEASYGLRPYEKDTISVTGRIELPIRRSTTIDPQIREAIARREAASQQIEVLRQQLRRDLGIAAARRAEAAEQLELHLDELVPQAKLGFESALASYESGKDTFEAALSSLQSYLALNIDYFDFLRQQQEAEADIVALRSGARGSTGRSATTTAGGMR